jgi:hypothetical protein
MKVARSVARGFVEVGVTPKTNSLPLVSKRRREKVKL